MRRALLVLAACGADPATKSERASIVTTPSAPSPAVAADEAPIANGKYLDVVDTDDLGACVLYADGRVACWTKAYYPSNGSPALVRDIIEAVAIHASERRIQIVLKNGKIWEHPLVYGAMQGWWQFPKQAVQIADHCVRMTDGSVQCYCPTAHGYVEPWRADVRYLAEGGNAYCAVTTAGNVECWGQDWGQLGDHPTPGDNTEHEGTCPTSRGSFVFGDATQVSVGGFHACVLRKTGKVECWGREGDIGGKPGKTKGTPVTVPIPPARAIRTDVGTCAIMRDAHAYCWGSFQFPGVGKPHQYDHPAPVKLPLEGVVAVSPGVSCAIVDRGNRVVCWHVREGCRDDQQCFAIYDVPMPP
jgi:alpha-tubulin suppressor-like RCC1 family protein